LKKENIDMANRALVVALSEYENPKNNLPGVENDVPAIMNILAAYGFGDVEVIRNQNATSNNIKLALNKQIDNAENGDVCIFYFSGHGIELPADLSGTDDSDGKDEAFVPYEGTLSSLILDNWLADFLKIRVAPKKITFWGLYDCCHSGDLQKPAFIPGLALPDTPKELRISDLFLDSLPPRISYVPTNKVTLRSEAIKELILDTTLSNSFHFGASEPNKPAICREIEGKNRSMFTWALEKVLAGIPKLDVEAFEKAVQGAMKSQSSPHEAQLSYPATLKNKNIFT
jgi:Caspase domain